MHSETNLTSTLGELDFGVFYFPPWLKGLYAMLGSAAFVSNSMSLGYICKKLNLSNVVNLIPLLECVNNMVGFCSIAIVSLLAYFVKELPNLPCSIISSSLILRDGTILTFGCRYDFIQKSLLLEHGIWRDHSILNWGRTSAGAITVKSSGTSFVFGGYLNPEECIPYEYLQKGSSTWKIGKAGIPGGFIDGCAIATRSEKEILLIGGVDTGQRILKFNVIDYTFEKFPTKLIVPRSQARCAFVPGTNKIMITGGCHDVTIGEQTFDQYIFKVFQYKYSILPKKVLIRQLQYF